MLAAAGDCAGGGAARALVVGRVIVIGRKFDVTHARVARGEREEYLPVTVRVRMSCLNHKA